MRSITLIVLLISIFQSCTPPLYIPNTTNVPSLTKKGDVEGSISTGTNGWDGQVSYAVTKNIGIMANGSFANKTSDSATRYHKHLFSEFGAGYTRQLNELNEDPAEPKYLFSVFGGGGLGSTEGYVNFSNIFNNELTYHNQIKGTYYKAFIQPSVGFSNEIVDFYFSFRTSYIKIYHLETSLDADWNQSYISEENYNQYKTYFERKDYNIFYEPTFTLKVGNENFKFLSQLGFSAGQFLNTQTTFRQRPIIAIFGIQGDFNIFKK